MSRGRTWLVLLAGLGPAVFASPVTAAERRTPVRYASPAAIVAAEIAFSQLARRKGQWSAFRATAAEDAVMFVPQWVSAGAWLKKQQDPPQAMTWQPHQVWLSCDGSLAASTGAWQRPDGTTGYFTTIWQRQAKGDYKWVLDQRDTVAEAPSAPEMIGSKVAPCVQGASRSSARPARPARPAKQPMRAPATSGSGRSDDGTLAWTTTVDARCGRTLTVSLSQGGAMAPVLEKRVAAPLGADGRPAATCVPS